MKKLLSVILSATLLISGLAMSSFSASATETENEQVYLWGDIDLDGIITIIDVTEIQRSLAGISELSGLQTELAKVNGEMLSINTATLLQKYLAGFDTGIPIGEPAGDKNEGIVYAENLPWYSFERGEINQTENPVYFSSKYPDVPFVSDSYAIESYLKMLDYAPECEAINDAGGLIHTYAMPMGTYIDFDYEDKLMYFSDYTSTLVINGDFMVFNPFSPAALKNGLIYKVSDQDMYHGGDPIAVTFAYDEVPMLKKGDDILIPLQTFSDFFLSFTGQFVNYNGKGVFYTDFNLASDKNRKVYYDLYCDAVKTDTVSSALAHVNYYEFCNVLDVRYGLKAAHNIATFDEYFNRMGIKERMLSTDLAMIEMAQQDVSTMLFEDFHSGYATQSVFLSQPIEYRPQFSPGFINRSLKMKYIRDTRTKALGTLGEDFSAYERVGDTVFITFDAFNMDTSMTSYVSEGYEPTADPNDTIALFAYALHRLQNEDKDAKNVVIDLACNGGGTIYSCGYAMQAICGQCNINIQNPNTWAIHQCVVDFDLNFDGKYDENDKSMLAMGLNVAVNISDVSFSCGNLLPNALDQLDDSVLLIGQQSGGGACSVGYLSTAIGSTMQISSENRFSTMKNGYIRDIDGGIAPDAYLTVNRLFNREYINDMINDYFG